MEPQTLYALQFRSITVHIGNVLSYGIDLNSRDVRFELSKSSIFFNINEKPWNPKSYGRFNLNRSPFI